ncbi:MAG: enoyl-CoA hydratase-related protein [Pseudomonadota bacterium]
MNDPNIHTVLDADGVLLATIDMPGRAMNVFSRSLMDSLESLMQRAGSDAAVRAVVLTSGKPCFLAGADLEMIEMFAERAPQGSTAELHELFGHLGRLFRRLELHTKPFVAALNGLALGGGLELALACRERVAVDDPAIQLGLPEVKLGLLPGAGGTQRLPRLVGAEAGLRMLLSGEPVAPQQALALGLVHAVVAADQLIETARRRALALAAGTHRAPWDEHGARYEAAPFDFTAPGAVETIARTLGISDYQLRHYPAYRAILQCVIGGWNLPMTAASEHEMGVFVQLMRDPVAGNMVRTLFLNRQKAAKLGLLKPGSPYASGEAALLPRLKATQAQLQQVQGSEQETLLALAFTALHTWSEGSIETPALADAAVVAAGLYPAYAGGPYTFLAQTGAPRLRALAAESTAKDARLFAVPPALDRFLAPAAA